MKKGISLISLNNWVYINQTPKAWRVLKTNSNGTIDIVPSDYKLCLVWIKGIGFDKYEEIFNEKCNFWVPGLVDANDGKVLQYVLFCQLLLLAMVLK